MNDPLPFSPMTFSMWYEKNRDLIDTGLEREACPYCDGDMMVCARIPTSMCEIKKLYQKMVRRDADKLAKWNNCVVFQRTE